MQKQITPRDAAPIVAEFPWIDLEANTKLQLTSENPAHPIEAAFRGVTDVGWLAEDAGPQSIRLTFYSPQTLHRAYLCIDATEDRTQEFVLRCSNDRGARYHDIVRQQYNFSAACRREEEMYTLEFQGVTDIKLEITPDISGGPALAALRVFRLG